MDNVDDARFLFKQMDHDGDGVLSQVGFDCVKMIISDLLAGGAQEVWVKVHQQGD